MPCEKVESPAPSPVPFQVVFFNSAVRLAAQEANVWAVQACAGALEAEAWMPLRPGRTAGLDNEMALADVLEKLQESPSWASVVVDLNDEGHWAARGSAMPCMRPLEDSSRQGWRFGRDEERRKEEENRAEAVLDMAEGAAQNGAVRAYRLKGKEALGIVFPWTDIGDESDADEGRVTMTFI